MRTDLIQLLVASVGALALAVGAVAALNGRGAGLVVALGGAVLLGWSVYGRKLRR